MLLETIAIVSCLVLMVIGSYTDLERREVPDWANYSMIFFGVGINLVYSLIVWNFSYLLYSAIGLAAAFLVAMLMFYSGQWGGGDSKMLMAIGALLGLDYHFNSVPLLVLFFTYTFIVGAFYGLAWSLGLAMKNRKQFWNSWKEISDIKSVKFMKIASIIFALVMMVVSFGTEIPALRLLLLMAAFMAILMSFTFVFVKAVEKSCMLKMVKPSELTEGDWIAKDVFYKGKRITGPKDLGISKENIAKLVKLQSQGKMKKVLIKNGVPFVPSFLIAFVILTVWGNVFLMFLN
jgi:Flp pilus assembly protein protease CpaA